MTKLCRDRLKLSVLTTLLLSFLVWGCAEIPPGSGGASAGGAGQMGGTAEQPPSAASQGGGPSAVDQKVALTIDQKLAALEKEKPQGPTALPVRKDIVIADFEGGSMPPRPEERFWGKALASFMTADLRDSQGLRIVDRDHLRQVMREQKISSSDLSDPATRIQVGKLVGANFFIFGTYTAVKDNAVLTARMDSVETGEIVRTEQAQGRVNDIRGLARKMARSLSQSLGAPAPPEQLAEASDGIPLEALKLFSQGLEFEQRRSYDKAAEMYTKALKRYPKYPEARQHLEKVSEAAARQ